MMPFSCLDGTFDEVNPSKQFVARRYEGDAVAGWEESLAAFQPLLLLPLFLSLWPRHH